MFLSKLVKNVMFLASYVSYNTSGLMITLYFKVSLFQRNYIIYKYWVILINYIYLLYC